MSKKSNTTVGLRRTMRGRCWDDGVLHWGWRGNSMMRGWGLSTAGVGKGDYYDGVEA